MNPIFSFHSWDIMALAVNSVHFLDLEYSERRKNIEKQLTVKFNPFFGGKWYTSSGYLRKVIPYKWQLKHKLNFTFGFPASIFMPPLRALKALFISGGNFTPLQRLGHHKISWFFLSFFSPLLMTTFLKPWGHRETTISLIVCLNFKLYIHNFKYNIIN